MSQSVDRLLWDDWHPVADLSALRPGASLRTILLGVALRIDASANGHRVAREDGVPAHGEVRYGFVWACLGEPARDIIDIPEASEDWRCITTSGPFGVHASAPRLVENFLDLGHLPFVHQGYLGAEPATAVAPYQVRPLPEGGIIATGCKMFQPMSSPAATEGFVVEYSYKVLRPLITCLHKANPARRDMFDALYLLVQPVSEERSIGNLLVLFGKDNTTEADLRWFQQLIFLQDKPILENQYPKRLPIGPRMEMAVAADKASVAYRRWLAEIGLRHGTIGGRALEDSEAA
jgi:phenylpropionate dioxygenase-like ring-hydroxylating dioxygenase large terminal subunit